MIMTTHFAVLLLLFASNFTFFLFLKNLAALFYKQCICNIIAAVI